MNIRPADTADATMLAQCLRLRLKTDTTETDIQTALEQSKTLALILESPSQDLIGCALGWSAGPIGELTEIVIVQSYEGRGCGRILLDAFLREMADRGVEEVQLEVRRDNVPAIALYVGAQFEEVGERSAYYADGMDALLYSRFF